MGERALEVAVGGELGMGVAGSLDEGCCSSCCLQSVGNVKDVVVKVAMQMIGLPAVIFSQSQSLPRGGCEWRLDALFDTAGECRRERRATHTGETRRSKAPTTP
jgi:hypothetical protein